MAIGILPNNDKEETSTKRLKLFLCNSFSTPPGSRLDWWFLEASNQESRVSRGFWRESNPEFEILKASTVNRSWTGHCMDLGRASGGPLPSSCRKREDFAWVTATGESIHSFSHDRISVAAYTEFPLFFKPVGKKLTSEGQVVRSCSQPTKNKHIQCQAFFVLELFPCFPVPRCSPVPQTGQIHPFPKPQLDSWYASQH